MAVSIPFRREISFEYGVLEPITPLIRRIVANNPGPFTYKGTGTYVVGHGKVAIIDPGPLMEEHVDALLGALKGETVTHIMVTHTHHDHSPAAALVKARTGAKTYGYGPHGEGFDAGSGSGADRDFVPDVTLRDNDTVEGPGWRLEALHTPGHCSNHLSFILPEEQALFSGDHVMGWSTSVVTPPDGDMRDYMTSLDKVLARDDAIYWPTHGPSVIDPKPHVKAFITHRHERTDSIVDFLKGVRDASPDEIVLGVYQGLDPKLRPAAARSVMAHLVALAAEGKIASEGVATLTSRYHLR